MPDRALKRAAELDGYLKTNGHPIGPLHGLPISVKEHVPIEGLDCNGGYISLVGQIQSSNAYIIDILYKAGAVFHARTTEPQSLMHLETSSNLFGETVNPFNRALTCGGSSGGEGALVGMRGSCLGIGTDIGGSIRSPAAANGVYGLRPTTQRLPNTDFVAPMLGSEHIVPVVGPLSTSIQGLRTFCRTIIDAKPWLTHPNLIPIPWREEPMLESTSLGLKKLKIGVIWDDGIVKPHPPVLRALHEVVEKLMGLQGVEVVDWKPYKHDVAWSIIASLYFADGGRDEAATIDASGEPWRPLSEFILKENPWVKDHSIHDLWKWTCKREEYRADYAKLWNETGVDVILCPAGPGAAPPLNCSRYWGYLAQWNLLDYPAVVFPVSQVGGKKDLAEKDYKPRNGDDEYNYKLCKYEKIQKMMERTADHVHHTDEPEKYKDAPISLQLVGRRYDDEKVLEALEYIQEKIGLPFLKLI